MIDHWWRPEFGRAPSLEELTDVQRSMVLARVLPVRTRWNRAVDVVLAIWLAGAAAWIVAAQFFGMWNERWWFVAVVFYILIPAYAMGWRNAAIARATRRAVVGVVRDERLDTIRTIIDRH